MALRYISIAIFAILLFTSCTTKQPKISQSSIIIFKTPLIKFYDKGFITKYNNYIHLQIYNAGQIGLNLYIYKDKICESTFKCIDSTTFNKKYFNSNYKDDFLYNLFSKDKIYFKDRQNKILIKVK